LGNQKKIDLLVMRAHGFPLGQGYAKEFMSPYSPRSNFEALKSSLTPDATIILNSCSNAVTCGEDDFAGFIRSMAPPQATVYAATRIFKLVEIQSGTPLRVRFSEFNSNFSELNRHCWGNLKADLDKSMKNGLRSLVEKGCAYEIDVTYRSGVDGYCNNPLDPDDMHKQKLRDRLDLLCPLVEKGMAYEAAVNAANEAFKSTDEGTRGKAIFLFGKLVDKGQDYEAAINAATEAFKSTDFSTRQQTISLFGKLVDKGQGYDVAINAATEAFKSTDTDTRRQALQLFGEVVDKGQGYEVAINAATEALKSTDDWTRNGAFYLLGKLVDKGQGYEVAISAATEAIEDLSTRYNAIGLFEKLLDLFGELVDQGQGYGTAISLATAAFKSTDGSIREKAIGLSRKLIDKGEGFNVALNSLILYLFTKIGLL